MKTRATFTYIIAISVFAVIFFNLTSIHHIRSVCAIITDDTFNIFPLTAASSENQLTSNSLTMEV